MAQTTETTSTNRDAFLRPLLVCPLCKGELAFSTGAISCTRCGERFPQQSNDGFNLLPEHALENDESDWEKRQEEMEAWYRDLSADAAWAASCFANDYGPYAPLLAAVSGWILDLGGGNGVVRHYLPDGVRYVSLDPSLDWLDTEWAALADDFPCLNRPPPFVRGVGEHVPFPAQTFDAVLAFWSLNHVSQPDQVFQEVHRVLKPGGQFLAVLEDMEPGWLDLLSPSFRTQSTRRIATVASEKLRCMLPNQQWPVQDDHLRLRESDLQRWSTGRFEIVRRDWIGQYLTYAFRKPASSATTA